MKLRAAERVSREARTTIPRHDTERNPPVRPLSLPWAQYGAGRRTAFQSDERIILGFVGRRRQLDASGRSALKSKRGKILLEKIVHASWGSLNEISALPPARNRSAALSPSFSLPFSGIPKCSNYSNLICFEMEFSFISIISLSQKLEHIFQNFKSRTPSN